MVAVVVVAVVVLGVLGTGVAFSLDYRLFEEKGATGAATVGCLLPVAPVTLGALFLDERVGPRVIAGMAVVLTGVALTRRGKGVTEGVAKTPAAAGRPDPAPAGGQSRQRGWGRARGRGRGRHPWLGVGPALRPLPAGALRPRADLRPRAGPRLPPRFRGESRPCPCPSAEAHGRDRDRAPHPP